MVAGRLHWKPAGAPIPRRAGLAAFDFPNGTLLLTEAGTKHRASLHVVRGERALAQHDPGGLDVLGATLEQFRTTLTRESHTLKRALTDPRLLDGIGNAYSDEILHAARLSPLRLTSQLTPEEGERLALLHAVRPRQLRFVHLQPRPAVRRAGRGTRRVPQRRPHRGAGAGPQANGGRPVARPLHARGSRDSGTAGAHPRGACADPRRVPRSSGDRRGVRGPRGARRSRDARQDLRSDP